MNYISGFYHRIVAIGNAVADVPQVLANSLPERVNAVALNAIHSGVWVCKEVKHIWNLGPVQGAKNAIQASWAAIQILRKPELVLQQIPNATNVLRYGGMACGLYQKVQGELVPFSLIDPNNLNLLADGAELTVMCAGSRKEFDKQKVLEALTKSMQLIAAGVPMIDPGIKAALPFQAFAIATTTLALASGALTLYVQRENIKKFIVKTVEADTIFDTFEKEMADADMTLDQMERVGFFNPSQKIKPMAAAAALMEIEGEKEPEEKSKPVTNEIKKRGISNPTPNKLSKEEEVEIDRAVRQLEDFWFFESHPAPPPKKKK